MHRRFLRHPKGSSVACFFDDDAVLQSSTAAKPSRKQCIHFPPETKCPRRCNRIAKTRRSRNPPRRHRAYNGIRKLHEHRKCRFGCRIDTNECAIGSRDFNGIWYLVPRWAFIDEAKICQCIHPKQTGAIADRQLRARRSAGPASALQSWQRFWGAWQSLWL